MTKMRRALTALAAAAVMLPLGLASIPQAQATACYSKGEYTSPTYAHAWVDYGSCKYGSTRSMAHINTTADSGWYWGSTNAEAWGFNAIAPEAHALGDPWR